MFHLELDNAVVQHRPVTNGIMFLFKVQLKQGNLSLALLHDR